RNAMRPNRVKTGIRKYHFKHTACGRVIFEYNFNVFSKAFEHFKTLHFRFILCGLRSIKKASLCHQTQRRLSQAWFHSVSQHFFYASSLKVLHSTSVNGDTRFCLLRSVSTKDSEVHFKMVFHKPLAA